MARKVVSIQDTIETNEDFENYLNDHYDKLICMEVYSEFCGNSMAMSNAVRRAKLDIGNDNIAMAKAASDHIKALSRFKDRSEPVFLFIQKGQLTRAMFGADGIKLCQITVEELGLMRKEVDTGEERPKFPIDEMSEEEALKREQDLHADLAIWKAEERLRILTLSARKKRVCERLQPFVKKYNFIMFWPHCHQAHYDLYEKLDNLSIHVTAKETLRITEEDLKELFYMSDVDPNEACVSALTAGEVLVVLYKMFDRDNRDFVKLLRVALYEEVPKLKEDVPPEQQPPLVSAFERYASISKTAREVRRDRHNARLRKLQEERLERERLAAEQARLARQEEEERILQENLRKEEERIAKIQAGLTADVEDEVVEGEHTEELETKGETDKAEDGEEAADVTEPATVEAAPDMEVADEQVVADEELEEEFHSDVSVEDEEYIPPGGLFVPGFYCPPNDLARANGLVFFYPKVISTLTTIETPNLPPHVLVMFHVDKRQDANAVVQDYRDEILNMGLFVGDDPTTAEHIAYTIKQYDKMERPRKHKDRLALAVSRKRSLAMLQLAGLNPCYISADNDSGERDCLVMFPVGYGDDYLEEESVLEEAVEAPPEAEPSPEKEVDEPQQEKSSDDEDDSGDGNEEANLS